uniref:Uncharacterized protein n=1 Tax=Hemiselmis andersenii TaxID=464988 RepID=A0A7S0XQP0_HEMAN|mmetsp:Transcript_13578/g.31625  ORF Transcript_13578/g.31625 Transcript_13578/m.31625 type:complete len:253 (+) Transcript_13578:2-760(+)
MIPEKLRPLALGGGLVAALYTLTLQMLGLGGDGKRLRVKGMDDMGKSLDQNPQKRAEQISALVSAAVEDMGLRRNMYIQVLSAALAAIGSAQGMLRIFQDPKAEEAAVWLSSPAIRRISTLNCHMVWMVASMALKFTGHYDKAAIAYLDRPKSWTPWRRHGMVKGRVMGTMLSASNYSVSCTVTLADGSKMAKEASFNLTEYDAGGGRFEQVRFVRDVQANVIMAMPWEEKRVEALQDGEDEDEEEDDDDEE